MRTSVFEYAVIGLLIFITSLLAVNLIKHKKNKKNYHVNNDAHYWELKYQIQYLIAGVSFIIAFLAYAGWGTMSDVKKELKHEADSVNIQTLANLNQAKQLVRDIDDSIAVIKKDFPRLLNDNAQIKDESIKLGKGFFELKHQITKTSSFVDSIKKDFVKDINYKPNVYFARYTMDTKRANEYYKTINKTLRRGYPLSIADLTFTVGGYNDLKDKKLLISSINMFCNVVSHDSDTVNFFMNHTDGKYRHILEDIHRGKDTALILEFKIETFNQQH